MPWQNPTPGIVTLGAPSQLYNIGTLNIAAAGTVLTPIQPSPNNGYALCNTTGYEIAFSLKTPGASANPFVTVSVSFYEDDNVGSPAIEQMDWHPAAGTSPSAITYAGKGPMRGQYMKVTVTPAQVAQTVTMTGYQMWGSGRSYTRDDWRNNTSPLPNVPGYTNPNSDMHALQLAEFGDITLTPSQTVTRLLPLYAGQCWCRLSSTSTSNQGEFEIIPQNIGIKDIIDSFGGTTQFFFNMPRDQCIMKLTNNQTTGNINIRGAIYIVEY